jgi:hypothetical protein
VSQFSSGSGGVDRGGINYAIKAQFEGRESIEQFKQQIENLRQQVASLKTELASVQPPGRQQGRRAREEVRQRREAAQATQEQARASEKAGKSQSVLTQATRQYNAELQRKQVSEARARVAEQRSFQVENRRLTGTEQLSRATARLTQAMDRLALAQAGQFRAADAGARGNLKEAASQQRAADAINRRAAAQRRLEAARQPLSDADLRRTTLETNRLREQFAIQQRLARLRDGQLNRLRAEEVAQRRIAQVERERQARAILAAQGRDVRGRLPGDVPARTARPPADEFARLRRELVSTEGAANRISFTFRRLFGILAAFTAARLAVGAFNSAIRETIRFMSELEITISGFAALLTATTDIFDEFGRVTDPQRRLQLALGESRRQMSLLRVEALETANTFDDLVRIFTAALSPGITAGLAVDEIRRLTLLVAQAGASIGADAQRIETDIRAILEGTIRQQRTGIARALGISDEEVRQARQMGRLFEFLEQRFSAFAVAGADAQQTFRILSTNIRDAFLQIGEVGLRPVFEEIRTLMSGTLDIVRSVNQETGDFQLNPRAVAIVQAVGDGLAAAASQVRQMRDDLTFEQALGSARAFAAVLQVGAEIVRGLVQGIVQGLDDIRRVFGPLFSALRGLGLFDEDSLSNVVALITRIFIIYTAFNTIVGGTLKAVIGMGIALGRTVTNVRDLSLFWGKAAANANATAAAATQVAVSSSAAASSAAGTAAATGAAAGATGAMAARWTAVRAVASRVLTFVLRFVPILGAIVTAIALVSLLFRRTGDEIDRSGNALERAKRSIDDATRASDDLGASFARQTSDLSRNAELIQQMRDDLLAAQREHRIGTSVVGLEGLAADARRLREASLGELKDQERLRDLDRERRDAAKELENIQRRAARLRRFQISGPEQDALEQIERAEQGQRRQLEIIKNLREERERLSSIDDPLLRTFVEQATIGIDLDIEQAERQIESLRREIAEVTLLELRPEVRVARKEAARLKQSENHAAQQLNDAEQQRNDFLRLGNQILARRLRTLIEQRVFEIRSQADVTRAEIDAAREVFNARQRLAADPSFSILELRKVEAEQELNVLRAQQEQERQIRKRNLDAIIQERRQAARDLALVFDDITGQFALAAAQEDRPLVQLKALAFLEQRLDGIEGQIEKIAQEGDDIPERLSQQQEQLKLILDVQKAINAERDDLLLREKQLTQEYKEQEQILDDISRAIEDPLGEGARAGFVGGIQEISNVFDGMERAVRQAIIGFRDFLVDTILDAFDPSSDTSTRERLSNLFRSIARMLLQVIIGNFVGGFFPGAHKGGKVAGLHDGGAVGMAPGGRVPNRPSSRRPRGLHPRDTVPIWADPREWVIRPAAVSRYGDRFMAAVNDAKLDPYQLAPLAGMQSSPSSPKVSTALSSEKGMQMGGQVGSQAFGGGSSQQTSTTVLPVLPASDTTMEMLVRGGRSAMLRFLQEEGFRRA